MSILIIRPSRAHSAYRIAAETFAEMAGKVTGEVCEILDDRSPLPDGADRLVVIGGDAVNRFAADLYFSHRVESFNVRCGTDGYSLIPTEINGKKILVIGAGRPRAAIYAVYRYFEVFCGCRYFWDGDRINGQRPDSEQSTGQRGNEDVPDGRQTDGIAPDRDDRNGAGTCGLPFENCALAESPRFEYRGLRYFAHRSLHRFQAEHWSLDDCKREIDWILKKRLNLFMLRIGLDDLYQRAFPDVVSYPALDKKLPEATSGYDDRSLFWPLEYRGELRKQLLAYAFERDLMHPEDCGTMTHWYSRTPLEYLEKVKPTLLSGQTAGSYREKTGLVWDIRDDDNLENYFRLTDTHIREYGRPELFHTIGLAERAYSNDREENLRLKLFVYRRIAAHLKEKYPGAPLFIASWDLWMFYTPDEVKRLLAELDPNQCILFDYTSDTTRPSNFTSWGVIGKYPWIFGIFSGYEPNSEPRGLWDLTNERIALAKADEMCKGVVLWPELSHGDTFAGEYLAYHAWNADVPPLERMIETFCADRYPNAEEMTALWKLFLPIASLRAWSMDAATFRQTGNELFPLAIRRVTFPADAGARRKSWLDGALALRGNAVEILRRLARMETAGDEFLRRDVCDLARTILGRFTDASLMLCETAFAAGDREKFSERREKAVGLIAALADLLGTHEDYSLYETLLGLRRVTETNPNFEATLKQNAENGYCRAYIYENAAYLYTPEIRILLDAAQDALSVLSDKPFDRSRIDMDAVTRAVNENRERFYMLPLAEMAPVKRDVREILYRAAELIETLG